jgi:hypothetical protein
MLRFKLHFRLHFRLHFQHSQQPAASMEQEQEQEQEQRGRRIEITVIIIWASLVQSWSCILMFCAEVLIELLILGSVIPYVPFRLDFFSLTTLSAVLGYQTLRGIHTGQVDVTRNALTTAFAVEAFLVIGDIMFIVKNSGTYAAAGIIRAPFVVLTVVNVAIVCFLYIKLHLFDDAMHVAEDNPAVWVCGDGPAETDPVTHHHHHGGLVVPSALFVSPQEALDHLSTHNRNGPLPAVKRKVTCDMEADDNCDAADGSC